MKWLIRLVANIVALVCSFGPFFSHQHFHNLSMEVQFLFFFIGFFVFSVSWSCGLFGITRHVILASLLGQFTFKILVTKEIQLFQAGIFLVVAIVTNFFTSNWKTSSEWANTFKTLWVDWLLLIPLFPIFSFTDLILRTDLFFPLMGYWTASTFYTVSTIKVCEFVWKFMYSEIYATQQGGKATNSNHADPLSSQYMIFIHHVSVLRSTWKQVHFGQLAMSVWLFSFLLVQWLQENEWERWQVAYSLGVFSTYFLYLGPISSGFALSPRELAAVQDAVN